LPPPRVQAPCLPPLPRVLRLTAAIRQLTHQCTHANFVSTNCLLTTALIVCSTHYKLKTAWLWFLKILHNAHPRLVRERVCFRNALHPWIRAITHGHKIANVHHMRKVVCDVTHCATKSIYMYTHVICICICLCIHLQAHVVQHTFTMSSTSAMSLTSIGSLKMRKRFLSMPKTRSIILRTVSHLAYTCVYAHPRVSV